VNQLEIKPSTGFAPVVDDQIRVLVLGSLPGARSLEAREYYAHSRNAFWPILAALLEFDAGLPYEMRCRSLLGSGVGLWDVLKSSKRPGSLDSRIHMTSAIPNDFSPLLGRCRQLRLIAFNGQKARALFTKLVIPTMKETRIPGLLTLPSTSPAHAAMSVEEKRLLWSALGPYLQK